MKAVVMLCTAAPGGMSQVVRNLDSSGLFEKYAVKLIVTHDNGSLAYRMTLAFKATLTLIALLLRRKVALVHAHVAMRGSFWRKSALLLVAMLFRKAVIVHLHGSQFVEFYERECGRVRRWAIRFILGRAHGVIVLSEQWHSYLQTIVPRVRISTIHNFVDAERMDSELRESGSERSSNTVLFLGEIGKRKGAYDLVTAMEKVIAEHPDAKFVMGGQGELAQLRACARSHGVDRFLEMPGWVSGEAKIRLLKEAAVYVLPSYNEGLPISILEAMAAGLPVVSTPVGGIPDAIHDSVEGFLVPPGEIKLLASRISQLLRDATLRREMGYRALQRVQSRFSRSTAIALIEKLYEECGVYPAKHAQSTVPRNG